MPTDHIWAVALEHEAVLAVYGPLDGQGCDAAAVCAPAHVTWIQERREEFRRAVRPLASCPAREGFDSTNRGADGTPPKLGRGRSIPAHRLATAFTRLVRARR